MAEGKPVLVDRVFRTESDPIVIRILPGDEILIFIPQIFLILVCEVLMVHSKGFFDWIDSSDTGRVLHRVPKVEYTVLTELSFNVIIQSVPEIIGRIPDELILGKHLSCLVQFGNAVVKNRISYNEFRPWAPFLCTVFGKSLKNPIRRPAQRINKASRPPQRRSY